MPSCQWREKPGAEPVCQTMVAPGSEYCPRHGMMEVARKEKQHDRELADRLKRQVKGPKPIDKRRMIEQGYQYVGNNVCVCGQPIEWWRTPNQHNAPYEPMPKLESACTSHFAYCRRAFERPYRRHAA